MTTEEGPSHMNPQLSIPQAQSIRIPASGEVQVWKSSKVDPITALQDCIDGLSLSLFEALRSLRDAVAPTEAVSSSSTTTNVNTTTSSNTTTLQWDQMDYDDFLIAVYNEDPQVFEWIHTIGKGHPPKSREEYVKLLAKSQLEKDVALVTQLSEDILSKSDKIEQLLGKLPGMNRTKQEQMKRIDELIQLNRKKDEEWKAVYKETLQLRTKVRCILEENTCTRLGIAIQKEQEEHGDDMEHV